MGLFKKKLCIQRTARGVLNVVRPRPTPNTCIYDDLAFFVPSDDILRHCWKLFDCSTLF
ncbi:hypothetical protein ACS0TY_002857 [Phlomoides rotata]